MQGISLPLVGNGKEWTLTIPATASFSQPRENIALKCRATRQEGSPFAPAEMIPCALTIFDSLGSPHTCDGVLQEAHTPLVEFIRHNCSCARRDHLRVAIESIASVLEQGLRHGRLCRENICFDEKGAVRLADYPMVTSATSSDFHTLGSAAILLHIGGCNLNAFGTLISKSTSPTEQQRRLRCILSAAEYHGSTTLSTLCSALLNRASDTAILSAIRALSQERFAPLDILPSLLESRQEENPTATATAAHATNIPNPPSETHTTIDFSLCERVEVASDNIVRYKRGGHWGYAYCNGEAIVIEREVVAAYDFVEGRAVIRTPRGYGLVDTSGRMVMNDVWEQMTWYGDENVAVAADQRGRWHIYDRMGRQLSTVACDWMGDASEGFVVARKGNFFAYFDTAGKRHTDFIYDEAFSFNNGVALVHRKGEYFHIDTSFHRIVE